MRAKPLLQVVCSALCGGGREQSEQAERAKRRRLHYYRGGRERERERERSQGPPHVRTQSPIHTLHATNTGTSATQGSSQNSPIQISHSTATGTLLSVSITDCCVHNGQNNNIHNDQNSNVLSKTTHAMVKTTCKMTQTATYWPKEH